MCFGFVIALAAALMAERLVRRRADAEDLAQQNARLFSEQRSVAQTLQHSLLPEEKPEFPGLDLAVRYVPGVDGVDIGGDWYDVIGVDDGQVILVVGDVSGRGLARRDADGGAALRDPRRTPRRAIAPEVILFKLAQSDQSRPGRPLRDGIVRPRERRRTPHHLRERRPPESLADRRGASADFVTTRVGPPVGVATHEFEPVDVSVPPDGTLLAYTDGLFERRGESPDEGLARLRAAATGYALARRPARRPAAGTHARRRSRRHGDPGGEMALVEGDDGARGAVEERATQSGASRRRAHRRDRHLQCRRARRERSIVSSTREAKPLVVDLTQLEFMDSSGIAMLLRAAGRVGTIEVRNPSDVVRRIIECTGLADVLHIET